MRILLAEDDKSLATLLRDRFRLAGHEVTHAEDGETAWSLVFAHPGDFDLALLDVMLPKLSGWDLCKRIKTGGVTSSVPVIILTAKTQEADEISSHEAGADEHVCKPFAFKDLLELSLRLARERRGSGTVDPGQP